MAWEPSPASLSMTKDRDGYRHFHVRGKYLDLNSAGPFTVTLELPFEDVLIDTISVGTVMAAENYLFKCLVGNHDLSSQHYLDGWTTVQKNDYKHYVLGGVYLNAQQKGIKLSFYVITGAATDDIYFRISGRGR